MKSLRKILFTLIVICLCGVCISCSPQNGEPSPTTSGDTSSQNQDELQSIAKNKIIEVFNEFEQLTTDSGILNIFNDLKNDAFQSLENEYLVINSSEEAVNIGEDLADYYLEMFKPAVIDVLSDRILNLASSIDARETQADLLQIYDWNIPRLEQEVDSIEDLISEFININKAINEVIGVSPDPVVDDVAKYIVQVRDYGNSLIADYSNYLDVDKVNKIIVEEINKFDNITTEEKARIQAELSIDEIYSRSLSIYKENLCNHLDDFFDELNDAITLKDILEEAMVYIDVPLGIIRTSTGFDIALSSHDEYIDDVCYELTIKIHDWGLNELDKVLQEYVTNYNGSEKLKNVYIEYGKVYSKIEHDSSSYKDIEQNIRALIGAFDQNCSALFEE